MSTSALTAIDSGWAGCERGREGGMCERDRGMTWTTSGDNRKNSTHRATWQQGQARVLVVFQILKEREGDSRECVIGTCESGKCQGNQKLSEVA